MRNLTLLAALALVPLAGCSQGAQSAQGQGAAAASFSPEMRAQMQRIRLDAKTASLAILSPQHRSLALASAKQFDDGTLSVPEAANKIDANLTPQETSALLAQQVKMRAAMKQAFSASGGTGQAGFGRRGGQGGQRTPDAGRFLVQVLASPDKLRAAMREGAPPTTSP